MSRFPRSSLFYFALVVVLGLVFWFTWQSLQGNQNASDWTYSDLISNIQENNVKLVDVKGTDAVATDSTGKKHNVTVPDCTAGGSDWCTQIAIQYPGQTKISLNNSNSGQYLLSVLLPNIILVVLIGGFMWYVLRQTQSGNNQAMSFGRRAHA